MPTATAGSRLLRMPVRLDGALAASLHRGAVVDLLAAPAEDSGLGTGARAAGRRGAIIVASGVRVLAVRPPPEWSGSDQAVVTVAVTRPQAMRLAAYDQLVLVPLVTR